MRGNLLPCPQKRLERLRMAEGLTPTGERLLEWHVAELEALLARCEEDDFGKPVIEQRLIEAYEALVGDA